MSVKDFSPLIANEDKPLQFWGGKAARNSVTDTPENYKEMSEQLKPCPFCGKWITLVSTSASAEWKEEFADDPFPHSESYAIVCDVNKDGCGGSSGYAASLEIATSRWNRRTP